MFSLSRRAANGKDDEDALYIRAPLSSLFKLDITLPGIARIVLNRPETRNAQDTRLLYDTLVSRAREPVFFAAFGVADRLMNEGRVMR